MFARIETEGPDEYGQWLAFASESGQKRKVSGFAGYGETEEAAIAAAKIALAAGAGATVEEIIQDGGVIRLEKKGCHAVCNRTEVSS